MTIRSRWTSVADLLSEASEQIREAIENDGGRLSIPAVMDIGDSNGCSSSSGETNGTKKKRPGSTPAKSLYGAILQSLCENKTKYLKNHQLCAMVINKLFESLKKRDFWSVQRGKNRELKINHAVREALHQLKHKKWVEGVGDNKYWITESGKSELERGLKEGRYVKYKSWYLNEW